MPDELSPRHNLPFLYTGQAQKEFTHNEALLIIDALLHPIAEAMVASPPSALAMSDAGKCWVIATGASGIWQGKSGQLAYWTGGSWRYLQPKSGMNVYNQTSQSQISFLSGIWQNPTAITAPTGGTIIDIEARSAINAIVSHLRDFAQIPE